MKKKLFTAFAFWMIAGSAFGQLIPISDARLLPLGSTVTVNGVVTSGDEFGTIRYIQDGSAGVAVFSTSLAAVNRGDNITVTGVTMDYQSLLEISPVTAYMVNSLGNPLPAPAVVAPSGLDESVESQLVQVNNANFISSGTFQGNTSYSFISGGDTGVVYIRGTNPLVGQIIPSSNISITGICSQFSSQYQLLPRDQDDLVPAAAINITMPPFPINFNTSGMDVQWATDVNAASYIMYGHTPALEIGTINASGNGPAFGATITGGSPSDLYYVKAVAVVGSDTAFSNTQVFITASGSSGTIKTYFNRPIDSGVANPPANVAVYTPNAFDDTIKAYIDRCQLTLDIAIYNFDSNNTAPIVQAINDALSRGVQIRIIAEGGNNNSALSLLDASIPVVLSPTVPANYYGIMHHKFMVMDVGAIDPNLPVVMGGSTNWSDDQLNTDRNHQVFIQDKSLARVYTMEFEEMWGGSGAQPVPGNAKFGPDKTDNTPHELSIDGKRFESYFSPSDNTNYQIGNTIGTADDDLYFALLVFTRYDLAWEIEERVSQNGVYAAGIIDDSTNGSGTAFLIMQPVMNNNLLLFDHQSQPGILHHKYLIVDQVNPGSDPLVLTGSHNWSNAANLRNDENTMVIHDGALANQFYQEFHNLFNSNGGSVGLVDAQNTFEPILFPNPSGGSFQVLMNSKVTTDATAELFSITGSSVWQSKYQMHSGVNRFDVPDTGLQSGLYFLKITTAAGVSNLPLQIIR